MADAALIARVRAGDASALDALVRTYALGLITYATRRVGSEEQAQEIVQDVFLHLWKDRAELDVTHNVAPYLLWLTRNRAIDVVRSERAMRKREERWVAEHESVADASVEAALDAAEVRAEVWEALTLVPPRCREIFLLAWDQQLSYGEIAQQLGISVLTVRNQMSRAVKQVVETLKSRFGMR